jgi:hypothetical protein
MVSQYFVGSLRNAIHVIALCIFTLASPYSARADDIDGSWSSVHDWPLIAIHAALTPDGRVFGYDSNANMYYVNSSGTGSVISAGQLTGVNNKAEIWNPNTGDRVAIAGGSSSFHCGSELLPATNSRSARLRRSMSSRRSTY